MSPRDDMPSRAEAEADAQDTRTPMEKAMDLGAYVHRADADSERLNYAVSWGGGSLLVPGIEVGRGLVAIINLTSPSDLDLIITTLLRAYGEKCVAQENVPAPEPEDDGYEPDDQWDDEDPAF